MMQLKIKELLNNFFRNILPHFSLILATSNDESQSSTSYIKKNFKETTFTIDNMKEESLNRFNTPTGHLKWNISEDCSIDSIYNLYYSEFVSFSLEQKKSLENIRLEFSEKMYDISNKIYACFEQGEQLKLSLTELSSTNYSESNVFYNWFNLTNSSLLKKEYLGIFIFLIIASLISLVIIVFAYLLTPKSPETEKLSTYECGFEPYEDARHTANISFCIIAVLFIVFDIEIIFLIPWSVSLSNLPTLGFWSMLEFIVELGVGILYVWIVRSLDQ